MDDDDGFTTSDAEIDSEIEDTDVDGELGIWLDQLNTYTQEDPGAPVPKRPPSSQPKVTLSPKLVMDSFRSSFLEGGDGQDLDLDAILGELCQLETQLTTQQSEISTSMHNAGLSSPKNEISPKTIEQQVKVRETTTTPNPKVKDRDSLAELQSALDDDLHSALSELSDLVGINFNDPVNNSAAPQRAVAEGSRGVITQGQGHTAGHMTATQQVPNHKNSDLSVQIPQKINGANTTSSAEGFQDYSPDGADADSAFSDSSSLPSSGSHVSVTTTSSQQSNGSGGSSGSSGVGMNNATADRMYGILEMDCIKEHLRQYQKSLEKQNLPLAEQAAKLKAEKIRIALEKIKEANIQKLFVRFYSEDNCSKSILVDEKTSVLQTCERLIIKNNVTPSENWAVVEHLPELFMERLLEDHEFVMESLMMWTRDSKNRLLFVQSPGKYHVFQQPEVYLSTDKKEEDDVARESLIEEYFSGENIRFPEIEGQLYLKSEGKKAWKKFFFVLRASGLYYSPKGKGKTSKDLVCLQKLDIVDVYTAVAWKKKYKAPTEFGFALKHAQIQKKTPKYIKYLCAEDQKTFSTWVTGIRIAKYGNKLYENFKTARKNFDSWGSKDILPNQNFLDYLTKQNERNQEFAKEHHLLPRKSVCQLSTQAMGDISENDGESVASGDSGQKRMSSMSKMSYTSGENTPPRKASIQSVGNGSCRRGSFPILDQRPSLQNIDFNQNQDYMSDEDIRTPTKKVPNIPVTTQTTKLLTDQNAASGTLKRRPSQGTIKKRPQVSNDDRFTERRKSGGMDLDMDGFPLPPPPPEMLNPPLDEVDKPEPAYSEVVLETSRPEPVVSKPPIVGGSLPNSPQKRPPVYAKPQIGKVQAAQASYSAPQSPAHKPTQSMNVGTMHQYGTLPQNGTIGRSGLPQPQGLPHHGTMASPPPPPPVATIPTGAPKHGTPIQSPPHTPKHTPHLRQNPGQPQYQYGLPQHPPPTPPHQQQQYGSPQHSPYGTPQHSRNLSMPGSLLQNGMVPSQNASPHTTPTHGTIHRRGSSNPMPQQNIAAPEQPIYQTPKSRPPPPPKRSQNTKLSMYEESPQAQYFISDLSRVLSQKQEWSQGLTREPDIFPPEPPPGMVRVHSPQAPVMDEWLPPPPAELLEGLPLQRTTWKSRTAVPPPVQKKSFVPVARGQH